MLDKNLFVGKMILLNNYYTKFDLNIKDETLMTTWYSAFAQLDNDTFNLVIKTFLENEIYPPQSPTHILQVYKQNLSNALTNIELSPSEAFEKFREIRNKNGGILYPNCRDRTFNELHSKYPLIAKVAEEMEQELAMWQTNDPYVPKRFKEAYSYYLEQSKKNNSMMQLGNSTKLKIDKLVDNQLLIQSNN